ncbi:nucleoside-diphosphate kinase [Myxococcota bacterium]|nr:nucleoside-diphosphate kinase [Myxococcota bacterium]MBU1382730.1 nucleoside-diphosphate kinase [Myxococcota bacterium]MBU1498393.1 nucleoside-diphosphate kinase [Myxococcota bacterium]
MIQRTFAMIKPDAVKAGNIGNIINIAQEAGLKIVAMKMMKYTRAQAEGFYAVHKGKPFFEGLMNYITEGPLVAIIFEGEDAISVWRKTMGATDPTKAEPGTIRALYAESTTRNSVHGSDAVETAAAEIAYIFSGLSLVSLE